MKQKIHFPAEWHPQSIVLFTWPHKLTDWTPVLYEVTDFVSNGWGMKFVANYDNLIIRTLAKMNTFSNSVEIVNIQPFVLEGGSLENDGNGTLLTTAKCIGPVNRNEYPRNEQLEAHLKELFGLSHFLWLENGYLIDDDTNSHIDMLARFCDEQTIAYIQTQRG